MTYILQKNGVYRPVNWQDTATRRMRKVLDYALEWGGTYGWELLMHELRDMKPEVPNKKSYIKKPITKGMAMRVYERDGFKCQVCGIQTNLSCDHIIPESKGGPTEEANLQTLCRTCNRRKSNHSHNAQSE